MDEIQNDAPFVAFYDMHAVMFVPPDEMADVTIAGLQWSILIPRLNHMGSHRPIDSHSIAHLHWEKNIGFGTRESFESIVGKGENDSTSPKYSKQWEIGLGFSSSATFFQRTSLL